MAKKMFEFDVSDYNRYFALLSRAAKGEVKKAIAQWFEASGFEFLRVMQDEIIRRKVVDTRLLLHSFEKGEDENVWEVSDGGLRLEVGTNLAYAEYVNDGHWTCKKGEIGRWVPGVWKGGTFTYVKGAKTGMALKQKWIEGSHYWEAAIRIFELTFRTSVERKMRTWGEAYFRK